MTQQNHTKFAWEIAVNKHIASAIACVLMLLATLLLPAQTAHATLLSALLVPGQSITVGDLTFNDFTYNGFTGMPAADSINVVPYNIGGDSGITFQGAFIGFPGIPNNGALFSYQVTASAGNLITGAGLAGNPAVVGGSGAVSVLENTFPDLGSLEIFSVSPGTTQLTDSLSSAVGAASLSIHDTLQAGATSGAATLSFFTPTFHVVPTPEPASITLLGVGLTALAARGIKRCKSVIYNGFRSQSRGPSPVSAIQNRSGDRPAEKNLRFFGILQHLS